MSPLWVSAPAVEVAALDEQPISFVWHGSEHRIVGQPTPWRVDTRWWGQALRRDYWSVATDTGLLAVIYWETGQWHLERIYE